MKVHFSGFFKDEKGTAVIEYALIACLISLVIVAALRKVGKGYSDIYNNIGEKIENGDAGGNTDSGG